jgi:hypothetical protein
MGGAHHEVGSLSRKGATPSTLGNNQRGTGATQRTLEGTYTDEGKEGSAKARTERLEDIDIHTPLGGYKHAQHARCQATRGQNKSARTGDEGGASAGTQRHLAEGGNLLQVNC